MKTENFEMSDAQTSDDAAMIAATLRQAAAAVEAGEVEGLMAMFHDSPETFIFDYSPPRTADYQKTRENFLKQIGETDGKLTCEYLEIHPNLLSADAAWSWSIMHVAGKMKDGSAIDVTCRATDIWRKFDGKWRAIHEHSSFPADPMTGQADLQSKP